MSLPAILGYKGGDKNATSGDNMKSFITSLVLVASGLLAACDDAPEPGWVGLSHTYVKPPDVKRLGLKNTRGARITKIAPGGPADDAGLKVDDVIFAFHGKKVSGPKQFAGRIAKLNAGETFSIAVLRRGKVIELEIETEPKPD